MKDIKYAVIPMRPSRSSAGYYSFAAIVKRHIESHIKERFFEAVEACSKKYAESLLSGGGLTDAIQDSIYEAAAKHETLEQEQIADVITLSNKNFKALEAIKLQAVSILEIMGNVNISGNANDVRKLYDFLYKCAYEQKGTE